MRPLALDLCLFINGLPVFTFELKNSLTGQTVEDAVQQYKRDRDRVNSFFQFGLRPLADDSEVRFCTHTKARSPGFSFNQGWNDGAGNPPNPDGLKTDYSGSASHKTSHILENYCQIVESKDEKTGKRTQIFPATIGWTLCGSF